MGHLMAERPRGIAQCLCPLANPLLVEIRQSLSAQLCLHTGAFGIDQCLVSHLYKPETFLSAKLHTMPTVTVHVISCGYRYVVPDTEADPYTGGGTTPGHEAAVLPSAILAKNMCSLLS